MHVKPGGLWLVSARRVLLDGRVWSGFVVGLRAGVNDGKVLFVQRW